MNLDEAQRKTVASWIEQGVKLSDIQSRLTRFLVDDLKLMPKDPVVPVKPEPPAAPAPADAAPEVPADEPLPPGMSEVTVTVDQITRAGSMISGVVTFSDGKTAEWMIDQMGRPRLVAKDPGYRPSQEDLMAFQVQLESQLSRLGF